MMATENKKTLEVLMMIEIQMKMRLATNEVMMMQLHDSIQESIQGLKRKSIAQ